MCNVYSQVERAFKSFILGTYKAPTAFSNENVWGSMEDFRGMLLELNDDHWGRILDSLGLQDDQYGNQVEMDDLSTLSAYRGGLVGFDSPLKGEGASYSS